MSCGVGCRQGSDPALLWLWRRPAPTALISPVAWEPPYAAGMALKIAKKRGEKKKGIMVHATSEYYEALKTKMKTLSMN